MLLEIKEQETSINNVNFRKENHGPDHVLAADVKFSMTLPVAIMHDLAIDSPPIPFSEFFYHDPAPVHEGDGDESSSRKRELGIASLSMSIELFEHKLVIQSVGENMPPIEFDQVKINSLVIALDYNRNMKLAGRFQFEVPNDDELIGRLAEFIKADAKVSILPPAQTDLVDEVEHKGSEPAAA